MHSYACLLKYIDRVDHLLLFCSIDTSQYYLVAKFERDHQIVLSVQYHDRLPKFGDIFVGFETQVVGVHWFGDRIVEPWQVAEQFRKWMFADLIAYITEWTFHYCQSWCLRMILIKRGHHMSEYASAQRMTPHEYRIFRYVGDVFVHGNRIANNARFRHRPRCGITIATIIERQYVEAQLTQQFVQLNAMSGRSRTGVSMQIQKHFGSIGLKHSLEEFTFIRFNHSRKFLPRLPFD